MFNFTRFARHAATRGIFDKRTWLSFFDATDLHEDVMKIVCYMQDDKTMSAADLLEKVFSDLRKAVYIDGCSIHNASIDRTDEGGSAQ